MKKALAFGLIGAGALYLFSSKKETTLPAPPPAPGPGPVLIPTTNLPTSGDAETGNTAVSGIREFSKDQYAKMKSADWKLILKEKLAEGKDLSSATQETWELWNNPSNPYRTYLKLPVSLLAFLVVNPVKSKKVGAIITHSSTPVYPTWYNWTWDFDNIWDCADWKAYHKALEDYYEDTEQANAVWEQAWESPDNLSGWTAMFSAGWQNSPLYSLIRTSASCTYACNFVEYMYEKGVDISSAFSSITCSLQNFATNIVGGVADIGGGIRTTTKIAAIAIPIAAGVLAYAWVSKTEKDIRQGNTQERQRAR